jgi:hypothetical protein
MPREIVELDAVVPDDIEFRYQGKKFILPGDVSTAVTFKMQRLLVALADAEVNVIKTAKQGGKRTTSALAAQERLTLEVEELLLGIFKENDPELTSLPFGAVGFQHVLARLLIKLGLGAELDPPQEPGKNGEVAPDPTKAAKPKRSSRSKRSSMSRSS